MRSLGPSFAQKLDGIVSLWYSKKLHIGHTPGPGFPLYQGWRRGVGGPPGGREVGPHPGEVGKEGKAQPKTVKLRACVKKVVFGALRQGWFLTVF